MGRRLLTTAALLLFAAQGLTAQDSKPHVVEINARTFSIRAGEYPPGIEAVSIPLGVQEWLRAELQEAGTGNERAYCIYGRYELGADTVFVEGAERAVELGASPNSVTPLPCPPEAVALAHLHTRSAGEGHCWWSPGDMATFKNRVIMFGRPSVFDLLVCWNQGSPALRAWDWDDLKLAEQRGGYTFNMYGHAYARALFLQHFEVDIDTLYVGRWP